MIQGDSSLTDLTVMPAAKGVLVSDVDDTSVALVALVRKTIVAKG
jgi:hypothetical protein